MTAAASSGRSAAALSPPARARDALSRRSPVSRCRPDRDSSVRSRSGAIGVAENRCRSASRLVHCGRDQPALRQRPPARRSILVVLYRPYAHRDPAADHFIKCRPPMPSSAHPCARAIDSAVRLRDPPMAPAAAGRGSGRAAMSERCARVCRRQRMRRVETSPSRGNRAPSDRRCRREAADRHRS